MKRKKKFYRINWGRIAYLALVINAIAVALYASYALFNNFIPKLILKGAFEKLSKQKEHKYRVDFPNNDFGVSATFESGKNALNEIIFDLRNIGNDKDNNAKIYTRFNETKLYVSLKYSRISEFETDVKNLAPQNVVDSKEYGQIKNILTNKAWFEIDFTKIIKDFDKLSTYKGDEINSEQRKKILDKSFSVIKINHFYPFVVEDNRLYTKIVTGFDKDRLKEHLIELDKLTGSSDSLTSLTVLNMIDRADFLDKDYVVILIDMRGRIKKITIDKISYSKEFNNTKPRNFDPMYPYIESQLFTNKDKKNNKPLMTIEFDYDSKSDKLEKPKEVIDYMKFVSSSDTTLNFLSPVIAKMISGSSASNLRPSTDTMSDVTPAAIVPAPREIYQRKTDKSPTISSGDSVDKELFMIHNMLSRYYMETGQYPETLDPLAYKYFPGALPINPSTGQPFYYHPLKDGQLNKGFMLCPAPGQSTNYCIKKWEMFNVY